MQCEDVQQNLVLAQYGDLPDELQLPTEQHLGGCEACRQEWEELIALGEQMDLLPMEEPSPNLLAASRMRLDEALDAMPPRSLAQRFRSGVYRWFGFVQGAPALTAMLLGVGYLGGNAVTYFQAVHQQAAAAVQLTEAPVSGQNIPLSSVASVANVERMPGSDQVRVDYNRLVPASTQGHLDDPAIRNLLMVGMRAGENSQAHEAAVDLLAAECRNGHACGPRPTGELPDGVDGIRDALLGRLRADKSPVVRLSALNGLQPYVAEDQQVRDAVLDALMHDRNEKVRAEAISMLSPVGADSAVRQALRAVSAEDANPAIRTASYQVLQSTADIQ